MTKTETKTKRTPKIRSIDQLIELSVDSMTGAEAKVFAKYLKEQLLLAETRIEEYKHNIESTRAQDTQNIQRAEAMERYYRARFNHIENVIKSAHESIILATKGDIA